MANKYGNKKILVGGLVFDSQKEYSRYCELRMLERAGYISNLQRQVKFILIPAQREPDIVGKRGGIKKGKLLEKECAYIADFVYTVNDRMEMKKAADSSYYFGDNCKKVAEDTKGFKTKDYIIKRKLMLYVYGIKIKEV